MPSTLLLVGKKTADAAFAWAIKRGLDRYTDALGASLGSPFALSAHRAMLRATLASMPFIYQGMSSEVLNDFVSADLRTVDLDGLAALPKDKFGIATVELLRERRKALFIGDAGVGKTTFFRYIALAYLAGTLDMPVFHSNESLVPIYVPLKSVDNSSPQPIMNFIVTNIRLFYGESGRRRLFKYARRKRLFFILDGYDEIAILGSRGSTQYVQSEIDSLVTGRGPSQRDRRLSDLSDIYSVASACRVWLSSRINHMREYRIDTHGGTPHKNVVGVHVSGVGNSRTRLVNNIFNKYKTLGEFYREQLDAEYFVQQVDAIRDEDVKALSFIPLFLTVMCYTYVEKVKLASKFGSSTDAFAASMSQNVKELIRECIQLLLYDLDEGKIRNIPEVQRQRLLSRRNRYKDAKELYLPYLAWQLYQEQLNLFDAEDMGRIAIEFFERNDAPHRDRILAELKDGDLSFVHEYRDCGVVVPVDPPSQSRLRMDFPHRRFREVSAITFVESGHEDEVFACVDNGDVRALIRTWFYLSADRRERILRRLCEGWSHGGQLGQLFGSMVLNLCQEGFKGLDIQGIVEPYIGGNCLAGSV